VYRPLPRFLLRAPLLPVATVWRGARALLRQPLGPDAVRLASPSLARAAAGARRDRALDRYARRAAFRPTPHGLLAGVCMGRLADRTAVATGTPVAHLAPTWARIEALARALLDDPDLRARTRLRIAPSALLGASVVRWLGPGTLAADDVRAPSDVQTVRPDDPFDEVHEAELVEPLPAILEAARQWATWSDVRAAAGAGDEADDLDELLLTLVDDGLLHSDLAPPIVGAPAGVFMRARLDALGEADAARALAQAVDALAAGDLTRGAAGLDALPGSGPDPGVHAVLVHRPRQPPTLERAAVERAARLAPLLVRLQDALAAPAAERFAQPALADALDTVTELYGAGAFDVSALGAGDYGVELHGDGDGNEDDGAAHRAPDPRVLTLLLDAIGDAGRHGRDEATVDAQALEEALRDVPGPRLPCSAELFLAPLPRRPRKPPGTGWLLGLHAPAAASLGRFGHALGADALAAITELEAAERRARPTEMSVDVGFAPTPALTDLAARPRTARRTLALSRWSGTAADGDELAPALLELVADPEMPDALALRERASGDPIVPASFARLRSRTAPAGIARLLVGWSLWRQHASWALPLGPLAELAFIPRLSLDGFVIAPASWRLPADVRTTAAIRRWRQAAGVPRHVQVGDGDELLPVDLTAPAAAADLADHERVFEIWPPLDETADRDGRRLEAVVMLIEDPDARETADNTQRAAMTRSAGAVPPPARLSGFEDWRTFKLFGAPGRQDDLLGCLVPAIRAGQHAGEIDRWFFQRYVDGPGTRHHLRVRVQAQDSARLHAFESRLRDRLRGPRAEAIVTGVEIDDYRPELGRFRAEELDAVHDIFESDSELACALLPSPADPIERISLLVRAIDALVAGLGLGVDARHALAVRRRRAAEASAALGDDDRARADVAFRRAGRALRAALAADGDAGSDPADLPGKLAAHHARIAHAARGLPTGVPGRLLPTLLHLSAVRHVGADRHRERLAYTFWERTLQGLRTPQGRPKPPGSRQPVSGSGGPPTGSGA
jgi:thiopeptide-type bacteriocin biosynthesis protein